MAKRWLQSLDVEVDDEGHPIFALSAPIEADIIDADLLAVTGTAPNTATLYDLWDALVNTVSHGSSLADVDASLMPGGDLYELLDGALGVINASGTYGLQETAEEICGAYSLADLHDDLNDGMAAAAHLAVIDNMGMTSLVDVKDSVDYAEMTLSTAVSGGASLLDILSGQQSGGDLFDMLQLFYDDMWLIANDTYDLLGGDIYTALDDIATRTDHLSMGGDTWTAIDGLNLALSDIYSALTEGSPVSKENWSDLTAPGSTPSVQNTQANPVYHVLQVRVQNINTNVVVRLEGSMDNNGWYNLGGGDLAITANGYVGIHAQGMAEYVRGTFVSEAGGTDAVVSFDYYGMR